MKTILFVAYAALIPAVPLYGTIVYRDEKHTIKRLVCWGLFAVQSLISIASIIGYLGQA